MSDLERIETRVANLEIKVVELERHTAVNAVEFASVKGDLREIKDSLSWVTRLILGALILAVIAFIVGGGIAVG